MASAIRIGGVAGGSVAGAAAYQKRLADMPQKIIADTRAALDTGADQLVERIAHIAPVSELEAHPGELRASVHKEDGRHDLSVRVVEDAKDAHGRGYAAHVEYGHKTPDGSHVAAVPHFWPSVRVGKQRLIADIRAAIRKAAKGAPA